MIKKVIIFDEDEKTGIEEVRYLDAEEASKWSSHLKDVDWLAACHGYKIPNIKWKNLYEVIND